MDKSKTEKLRRLASKRQIVRAKDASELGVPRSYLPRLARRGHLEKIARGLYSSRDFSATEHASLIEAAYQVPKGVICLLSALRFHNLTTQSPREVWMAIGHKAWAPKISSPPFDWHACPAPPFISALRNTRSRGPSCASSTLQKQSPTASNSGIKSGST